MAAFSSAGSKNSVQSVSQRAADGLQPSVCRHQVIVDHTDQITASSEWQSIAEAITSAWSESVQIWALTLYENETCSREGYT